MSVHQRRAVPVVYVRERSGVWTRDRFRQTIAAPVDEVMLTVVEARRKALSRLAATALPSVYAGAPAQVSAVDISMPRLYGHILHALTRAIAPDLVVEAGAGFGISGMYLGSALTDRPHAMLVSFELGAHAELARQSINLACRCGWVIQDCSSRFAEHLDPSARIDLVLLDAVHDYGPIMRDFKLIRGWLSPHASVVIDDLFATEGSRRAWREIVATPEVRFAAVIRRRIGFASLA